MKVNDDTYWSGDDREGMHYNEMVSIKDYPDLDMENSEHIVDYEYQYQYCLNISFNEDGTPGRGSAIFLHCLGPIKPYTGGCVAVPEYTMIQILQRVQADCVVVIDTSNNVTKRNGGGVYVFRTTEITISGGSITGNSAQATELAPGEEGGNGGGVYVSAHSAVPGSILVTGGTIENNTASNLGGGIYMDPDSVLKMSGTPKISGNTAADKSSNVQLGNKPITVTGKFADGASIGVTRASDSAETEAATEASTDTTAFTSGYQSTENTADPATYFASDDDAYLVGWTEDGKEARLVTAYNVVVEKTQNGTVTASAIKARAGDSIMLTVTASDGYQLKALTVLDANKKDVEVTDSAFIMPASDVTVSVTFEATYHTITFDANGGTGTMEDQSVATGKSATLNENKFTRSGYTFKEWNTKKDGSGVSYKNKATIKLDDNVTLYAQWTQNSSSSTSSKTSSGTLSKTADPTSVLGAMAMLVAGAGATFAGIRRKRR